MLCAVMEEKKFGRMVGRDSEKRWEEVDVRRKGRGGKGFDVIYSDLRGVKWSHRTLYY
jgi:hypothetical protein